MSSSPPPEEHTGEVPSPLAPDLVAFRESYVEMFGTLPPLPAAKFEVTGRLDAMASLGPRNVGAKILADLEDPPPRAGRPEASGRL